MSETTAGEACNITTGEEAGQDYVCRFALKGKKGLYFVWEPGTPGIELLEDGAEVTITHDGSKYPKVEKIEKTGQTPTTTPITHESKVEKTMKKVEAQDDAAWRIARAVATERVFGNGMNEEMLKDMMDAEILVKCLGLADEIAAYIATGQKPTMKKQ